MSEGSSRPEGPEIPRRRSPRQGRRPARRSFGAALGWTALGALVPGSALLVAGRRRLGAVVLGVFLLLLAGAVWLATGGQRLAARTFVDTDRMLWVIAGMAVLAVLWIVVVIAGYQLLVPPRLPRSRRFLGAGLVALLIVLLVAPVAYAGRLVWIQRDLIAGVFDDGDSATVEDVPDPFGSKERVNVLLLGGDGGEGRDGVRTDTVIVASIDTSTGDTVLFSLPRNLEELPFPEDSPLHAVYPDGFEAGSESESLLNAVYRNGPAAHPGILGRTDDPGADFLKLGVGEALGLHLDYYVLVNLDGFSRLVDALGGITVNVNYYVPIGGEPTIGILPDAYIAPGPNQHLDGARALDFARGRFGLSDYDRMARQRCTIQAIIDAANPVTLLSQYQRIAATTQDIVSTDIPRSALDDFVDLAFLVKDASISSVVFDPPLINPAYPDYDEIAAIVARAIAPPPASAPPGGGQSTAPPTSAAPSAGPTGPPAQPAADPATDLDAACAYDRARAAEALAEGEPPTRNR